jgi:hypothetical protein
LAIPWENLVAGDSWLEWDLAIADWGKRDPLLSLALDLKKLRYVLKDRAVSGTTVSEICRSLTRPSALTPLKLANEACCLPTTAARVDLLGQPGSFHACRTDAWTPHPFCWRAWRGNQGLVTVSEDQGSVVVC